MYIVCVCVILEEHAIFMPLRLRYYIWVRYRKITVLPFLIIEDGLINYVLNSV